MTRRVRTTAFVMTVMSVGSVGFVAPPAARAVDPVVVSSVDFDDSTTGTWHQSGSPTLGYVDDGNGGLALSILRAADYEGIESPTGLLQPGTEYTLSMRARLPEGTAGSTQVRFVVKPDFDWVANTTIDGAGWTTISGNYTLPGGVDPAAASVYIGSSDQAAAYTILVDDVLITAPGAPPTPGETVLSTDFESGLGGWVPRGDAQGDPTVALTTAESHSPTHAALVSDRTSQGDGIGHDVTGVMEPGTSYVITAWLKFAAGSPTDTLWLSMRRTTGGSDAFDTVGQFTSVSGSSWTEVSATYAMAAADSAFLYFESRYPDGTTEPFLVDDVTVRTLEPPVIEDLTPIKDTTDFRVGVAIDSRETTGAPAELLLRHFDQVTPENHMKPEAWYAPDRSFRIHPEAAALMDFARTNGTLVYGHTLVWHSQTPAWFFQHDDGSPLTSSPADQAILRIRLHDHIFDVAETLSDLHGPFGSSTNPLVAFDVVNEVVSDGTTEPDGLRRSPWYEVLGESYIDDAFHFADEAFNETFAAVGATRPVTLAINDYNTEQSGKRQRLHDLMVRLLGRGVPVDAVGHQFHLSLSTPVQTLEDAIAAFEDLPVTQVVSEMDVTTGTPVDEAKLIDQGYFYRDAFRIFRAHSASLLSVTVWGLYDGRSWRVASGAPLLFNDALQAKPAYYGAVDAPLDPRLRSAFVFQGSVSLGPGATAALEWQKLPLHPFGDAAKARFQLRWESDHLSAYLEVTDATADVADRATFVVGDDTSTFHRDGSGDVPGVAVEVPGGWEAVVHLPLTDAALNDQLTFDVRVTDGGETIGWNDAGAMGTLTLIESVSFTDVMETATAPTIDGVVDSAWATATTVSTGKQILGTGGATAEVRTLWRGNLLYVLAQVSDPVLDDTGSDPWTEDSVEIYVDAGNVKNGAYRFDDTQIRINYLNVTSFGTGDEAFQANRLTSATRTVEGGYVVEAAISLLEAGGAGTFHGLDFQVNDASGGARTGIRNWADPTGLGYQSTSRWGVGRLVARDATVPVVHLESPLHLTATHADGYHGLTAEIAGVTATDDGDDASSLVITSDAPAVLPIGTTVVTWTATDPAGNASSAQQTVIVARRIATSVTYTGPDRATVKKKSTFTLDARLSAAMSRCVASMPLRFLFDRDPVTGQPVDTLLGTATTGRSGKGKLTVSSSTWRTGTYVLTVRFAGNDLGCAPSSTTARITVRRAGP